MSDKVGGGLLKRCKHCGEVKPLTSFYKHNHLSDGRRPECKDCSKKKKKEKETNDPFTSTLNKLADNILKRTVHDLDKPKNKVYKERNIKCLLGNNRAEVRETLRKHYGDDIKRLLRKGLKPSVDRIDPYGHYELGNIQIVSLQENISRIDVSNIAKPIRVYYPNGDYKDFRSIKEAAEHLGCKRDTIYASLERPGINRRGLRFELIDKET
jgi:hypothetical protein